MRSATAWVVGSGSMATCFNARSQRKASEMPVSATSSGSGGPMLSISARVRIAVCDMFCFLFLNRTYRTCGTYYFIDRWCQHCHSRPLPVLREHLLNPLFGLRAGKDRQAVAVRSCCADLFAALLRST